MAPKLVAASTSALPCTSCAESCDEALSRQCLLPRDLESKAHQEFRICGDREVPKGNALLPSDGACDEDIAANHDTALEGEPGCKRVRAHSFPHLSYPQHAPAHVDRLQRLYPHPRDECCTLDEKSHTYHVNGEVYCCSVSGWVKQYFEAFDATVTSERIVERHVQVPGFRTMGSSEPSVQTLSSSVYNFAQRLMVLEKRTGQDFRYELAHVARAAIDDYASRGRNCPYSVECIIEEGQRFAGGDSRKPAGPSCYYLVHLYACHSGRDDTAADLVRTWELLGRIAAFKGTYLHKKIELYLNALVIPMERNKMLKVAVSDLLKEDPPAHEFSGTAVFRHLACWETPELWNHPLVQGFIEEEERGESREFRDFRSWLISKPRWTPLRVEWSLYNEEVEVAGQLDSLWEDLDAKGELILVDWKRTRAPLTTDVIVLEQQSFGRVGLTHCSHLYDAASSHYFVQQSLYAYLLASKYALTVSRATLVQFHPHGDDGTFNEVLMETDTELATVLAAERMKESGGGCPV